MPGRASVNRQQYLRASLTQVNDPAYQSARRPDTAPDRRRPRMNAGDIMTRLRHRDARHAAAGPGAADGRPDVDALPIVADGKLVGLVTHDDMIRALASRKAPRRRCRTPTGASAMPSSPRCRARPGRTGRATRPASSMRARCICGDRSIRRPTSRRWWRWRGRLPGVRRVKDHMTVPPQGDPFDRPNWPVPARP